MRDFLSRVLNTIWPSGLSLKGLDDDMRSIARLKVEGDSLAERSAFHGIDHRDVVMAMMEEVCEKHRREPHSKIQVAICESIDALMLAEGIIEPEIDWELLQSSFTYQDAIRRRLDSRKQFFTDYERHMEIWRRKMVAIFSGLLAYFPDHAFAGDEEGLAFRVSLTDTIEDLDDALDRILVTYDDEDFRYPGLSREVRETLIENLLRASGIDPQAQGDSSRKLVIPSAAKIEVPKELVSSYFRKTPFEAFFATPIPFSIPERARFEHAHILGGTGHGKTQMLQQLIYADIEKARTERRSVVCVDSQGDLIRKLSRLRAFGENEDGSLFDRLCLIDPSDIDHPVALNMFALNRGRIDQYGKAEREKILNGTVELYENFFGSLLGAELTQKQGVIFKYLARLMLEIPDANIHTLRDLMDDAEPFIPHMEKLKGSARYFFEREFFDRSFSPTKKQISKRLWGVLATPSFERMFAQSENKVDMFDLLNQGSIVLINTAKDLLKQEGCELFGRFFLSMISQAAMERSVIAEEDRTPTTVYVDEAQEYFDDNVGILLAQARKYKIGLICANQTLDQLSPGLRSSFMSNTGTKVVGGLSAKDANAFAAEMHTSAEFLQSLKKRQGASEFALQVRHHTVQAIRVEVPLGFLESQDTLNDEEYDELIDQNRLRFTAQVTDEEAVQAPFRKQHCWKPETQAKQGKTKKAEEQTEAREISEEEKPEDVPPIIQTPKPMELETAIERPQGRKQKEIIPPAMGRGGRQHRYLQELVKGLAEQHGFLARIEDEVLDGDGFVDVSLSRGEEKIACEISITTPPDKEVENIKKCLATGYELIWVIAPEQKHLLAIRNLAEAMLSETQRKAVVFAQPEDVATILSTRPSPPMETTVRGYRVRIKRAGASFDESQTKRATVVEVLAKSVQVR